LAKQTSHGTGSCATMRVCRETDMPGSSANAVFFSLNFQAMQ